MKLKEAKTLTKIGELKGWVDTSKSVISAHVDEDGISSSYAFELLSKKLERIEKLAEEISELTK
tara:strand:+ start:46 stop:237 length:192 start_codon:yes stop_codon:yes gene_type:complete